MYWVLEKRIAAGAIDDERFTHEAKRRRDEIQVIDETPAIPRHLVSARGDLEPALAAKIKTTLEFMDQNAEGQRILKGFQQTTKFDEIPQHALDSLKEYGEAMDAEKGGSQ
jgi:ABC-type phosphate/phosphonate transport system substrate-binding protein